MIMGIKLEKIKKANSDFEGSYKAIVYDGRFDPLECFFTGENCVHIDTDQYAYLELTIDNLIDLIGLIKRAEEKLGE